MTPNDLRLKERLCLLYKKTYNKQKALECYVDLLNSGLNTKSVNKHLGDLYLDLEKYQDALDHYIKIDTEDIKNLKMLHNLVKIYDKLKNKKELINTYGFIVELDPSNLKALFNLIRLNLNAQNKFPAAKALYQYLLQKQFDFKEYQELIKKFKGLKKMLPEMIFDNFDNFKDANKVTLFNFARILLANNLPTKSRIVFKTIFADQDTEDKLKAASLYKEFNFLEEAAKLYEGILEKEPENTDVLFELAYLNYCINNTESALAYADKLYEIDSDNLEVLMVMGEILTQKGSYQEAFDVVNKAESIDLLRKDIMRLKLKIMKKLKKNRPELAKDIKEYEKAVKNKTNKHDKEDVNSQCKKQKSWYDFN